MVRIAGRWGERLYPESEADIAAACARLARFGIDARHLRTFLTATGGRQRSSSSSSLRGSGRATPSGKTALDDLELLARVAQELSHLLFLRDLRGAVERSG